MRSMLGFLSVAMVASLSGCATVESVQADSARLSTYTLCMRLAAPGYMTSRTEIEIWRETIASRGQSCSAYQGDMDRVARQQEATLQSLTTRLNQQAQPVTPQPSLGTGFLKNSFRQGDSLICVYDRLGSPVYVTRRSVDICDLTTK